MKKMPTVNLEASSASAAHVIPSYRTQNVNVIAQVVATRSPLAVTPAPTCTIACRPQSGLIGERGLNIGAFIGPTLNV